MTPSPTPSDGTFLGYRDKDGNRMHCANAFCPHEEKCSKGCINPVAEQAAQATPSEGEAMPCPCCASPASHAAEEGVWHLVRCTNRKCGLMSGIFPTKPWAIRIWNTRAAAQSSGVRDTDLYQLLCNCAQILDGIKQGSKPKGAWSDWDQAVREHITARLRALSPDTPREGTEGFVNPDDVEEL